jgi:hypothetical protein
MCVFKKGDLVARKIDGKMSVTLPFQLVYDVSYTDKEEVQFLYLFHPTYKRLDWWLSFEWELIQHA